MLRFVPAALTGGALVWLAALVLAPYALASASALLVSAASIVYEAAAAVCHQQPDRSFHLSAFQMPVCARCSGLYASGAFGAAAAWSSGRASLSPGTRGVRLALALAALPTAATWGLERLAVWQPGNIVRALAALPLGAAAGWIFVTLLLAEARRHRAAFRDEPMRYHA